MNCDLHILERMIDAKIAEYFNFPVALLGHPDIKAADKLALHLEVTHLFDYPIGQWGVLIDNRAVNWESLTPDRFRALIKIYN